MCAVLFKDGLKRLSRGKKDVLFSKVEVLEQLVRQVLWMAVLFCFLLLGWEIHGGGGARGCVWRNC